MRGSTRSRSFGALLGAAALLAGALAGAPAQPAAPAPVVVQEPGSGDPAKRGSLRLTGSGDEQVLIWRSPVALPVTDARPEFRIGRVLLGHPEVGPDGRTLSLPVDDIDAGRVSVWLSGRRLDVRSAKGPDGTTGPAELAPVGPTVVPAADPGLPGSLATATFDYRAARLPWPEYRGALEVVGHVVLPEDAVDAPLVLILHGRHLACYGSEPGDDYGWPCRGESKPVPSHLGYDYLQRVLASQGYATVSVAANGINAQDWVSADGGASARSALVRHHLELLAQWTADADRRRWYDRLDLQRTVLIGHSRGGEGVNQAAVETGQAAPYRLVGQTLIAPTNFSFQAAGYLPTVTLLPYCDGDVFDLQGQRYVDAAATLTDDDPSLRSSVLMRGANHNFFNTEWTPGLSQAPSNDDWYDQDHPLCGRRASETRLSAAEQRRAGRTFIGASVAAFVHGDRAAVDIVDSPVPVRIPAAGNAVAWTHAIGGNRTRVALGDGAVPRGNATRCRALTPGSGATTATPRCGLAYARPLHWIEAPRRFASVQAASLAAGVPLHLRVGWTEPGRSGGYTFGAPLNLSAEGATLDLRVLGDPEAATTRFAVRLIDTDGDAWNSTAVELQKRPGGRQLAALHAQTVRIRTGGVAPGVDLDSIAAVELYQVSREGSLWVLDASVRRAGLAPVPDVTLPSITLGRLRVQEGDSPARRVGRVPFRVNGTVTEPASFGVSIDQQSFGNTPALTGLVELVPGQVRGVVEVPFHADDSYGRRHLVQLVFGAGLDDVTMRTYAGRLLIVEDDPVPTIELRAASSRVRYGEDIRVVVELSEPITYDTLIHLQLIRAPGTPPLRTDDVSRRWLERRGGDPEPGRALAEALPHVGVRVDRDKRRAVLVIPTRVRGQGQELRTLRVQARGWGGTRQLTIRVR
jgi:hypothetical protein